VRGVVATGERRGRELGYPTANLAVPPEILLPADGVYAGWYLRPGGRAHPAAIGVGRRPTFGDATPASLVEANLLDFDGDLYGEAARVRFTTRLRDDERFESPEALVAQMGRDVAAARDALLAGGFAAPGGAPPPPSSERRGPPPPRLTPPCGLPGTLAVPWSAPS
jgi:riboflavin kinase / FMN adenylyltransferase